MHATDNQRRIAALDTAFALFVRFGYRKTSMDEIARAVGVSRQGLYNWFPNKKALFTAVYQHIAETTEARLAVAFADDRPPVEEHVVRIFSAYSAAFISSGLTAAAIDELMQTAVQLLGAPETDFEAAFTARLAPVLQPFADERVSAHELARTLYAVSAGIKYKVASAEEYAERMRVAARAVCRMRTA